MADKNRFIIAYRGRASALLITVCVDPKEACGLNYECIGVFHDKHKSYRHLSLWE